MMTLTIILQLFLMEFEITMPNY